MYCNRYFKNIRFACDQWGLTVTKRNVFYGMELFSGTSKLKFNAKLEESKKEYFNQFKHRIKNTAGVLIPFCEVNNEPALLFTQRSHGLRRGKGQVSFPGGTTDESDKTVVDTALRETEEEIGLSPSKVDVWNVVPGLPDQSYQINVFGVVGYVGKVDVEKLCINTNEVFSVFTVPISKLADPNQVRYTKFRIQHSKVSKFDYVTPVYLTQPRIWGLTAILVDFTLAHLLPEYQFISDSFSIRSMAASVIAKKYR